MFIQDALLALGGVIKDKFPRLKFLIMFATVVIAPLILLVVAGRDNNLVNQPSIFWPIVAIILFLLISIGVGIFLFKQGGNASDDNSIL